MKYLIAIFSLALSINANASLLSIEFDNTDYTVGDTITGQLVVSNINSPVFLFSTNVMFDDSSLDLTDWTFGSGLGDDIDSAQLSDDTLAGALFLDEVSFLDEASAATAQGAEYILASFSFTATTAGSQTVSLDSTFVQFFDFSEVDSLAQYEASFNIAPANIQVPEPTTGILLLAGLVALLRRAKA